MSSSDEDSLKKKRSRLSDGRVLLTNVLKQSNADTNKTYSVLLINFPIKDELLSETETRSKSICMERSFLRICIFHVVQEKFINVLKVAVVIHEKSPQKDPKQIQKTSRIINAA